MNYHRMIEDIDELVNNDFVFDMECKLIPNKQDFTQDDAKKMLGIILSVYRISHTYHCIGCRKDKYKLK